MNAEMILLLALDLVVGVIIGIIIGAKNSRIQKIVVGAEAVVEKDYKAVEGDIVGAWKREVEAVQALIQTTEQKKANLAAALNVLQTGKVGQSLLGRPLTASIFTNNDSTAPSVPVAEVAPPVNSTTTSADVPNTPTTPAV